MQNNKFIKNNKNDNFDFNCYNIGTSIKMLHNTHKQQTTYKF